MPLGDIDGATEHHNRLAPSFVELEAPSQPNGRCPDGCQPQHRQITHEGLLCIECGAVQPLAAGQATARKEYATERVDRGNDVRDEARQHISESAPMTRIVYKVAPGKCRECIVRSVERISYNRIASKFICGLAARRKARFETNASSWLKATINKLTTHSSVCKRNAYTDRTNSLNRAGWHAVNEIQSLVAIKYKAPERSPPIPMDSVLLSAVRVCGMEDSDTEEMASDSPVMVEHVVLTEAEPLRSIRASLRHLFSKVQVLADFRKALANALRFCADRIASYNSIGSFAARFMPSVGFDPMVQALLRGDVPCFSTPELNSCIRINDSTCLQTAAEHLLEAAVYHFGYDHAKNIVCALASPTLGGTSLANVLSENVCDKRLAAGLVTKSRRLTVHRRMCCDDPTCKRNMCVGLNSFSNDLSKNKSNIPNGKHPDSDAQHKGTETLDTLWLVQTRLLAGLAICLSKRADLVSASDAIQLVKAASKEMFLASRFFAIRTSTFVSTATALVGLHGSKLFQDAADRKVVKHELSVQALAIALGFWPKYLEPCFDAIGLAMFEEDTPDAIRRCMTSFAARWSAQYARFFKEKGNATVDAALMYRRVQYNILLNKHPELADQFAACSGVGSQVPAVDFFPFPCPPPQLFKSQVNIATFASEVMQCIAFVRNCAISGSSHDNAMVRYTRTTFLDFDALCICSRQNLLGLDAFHRFEAGQAGHLADHAGLAPPDQTSDTLVELKLRAADLNSSDILSLASSAADRIDAIIPNFWTSSWYKIPELAEFPIERTRTRMGFHPAAGLLKRLDNTPYVYEEARDTTESGLQEPIEFQFASDAFATAAVRTRLELIPTCARSNKRIQEVVDMEVALSVLMHGARVNQRSFIGSVVPNGRRASPIDAAVSILARSDKMVELVDQLYVRKFLFGLRSFCDSLATKAMEMQLGNAMPSELEDDCPVRRCASLYFEDESIAKRAFNLHIARLERAVARAVKTCGRTEYYASGAAQSDVEAEGDRPTYSGQKRSLLCKHTATIATAATKGYTIASLLVGREWIVRPVNCPFDLSMTAIAVQSRLEYGATESFSIELLTTIEQFYRLKRGLNAQSTGYEHSTGAITKPMGVLDTVTFLARPLHESLFEGRFWIPLDAIASTIQREATRVKEDGARDIVVVRAAERAAAELGADATPVQIERRRKMHELCAKKTTELQTRWATLDPARKLAMATIAASLHDTNVTAFDIFCMRGVVAVLVGAVDGIDASELFTSTYCMLSKTLPTDSTKAVCGSLFVDLRRVIVLLNCGRFTLAEIPSFYRHRVVVQFLCEIAAKHGTIQEQTASLKIRTSGFCFLKQTAVRFYHDQINDLPPNEPTDDEINRTNESHVETLRESLRARDEAEERVADARFDGNGLGRAHRDAVRLVVGDFV